MYRLQRLNVVKIAYSAAARDELLALGYADITDASEPEDAPVAEVAEETPKRRTTRKKAE